MAGAWRGLSYTSVRIELGRRNSDSLQVLYRFLVAHVAGVERGFGFEQHEVNFVVGDGLMFHAMRHDDEFAFAHQGFAFLGAVEKFHAQGALEDEEEFVLGVVVVPDELAFHLHQLHVGIVQFTDNFRGEVIGKLRELFGDVHLFHAG